MPVFGSDEVNAVVLDVATHSTRLGYAGEDTPKCVIPSSYGYVPAEEDQPARYYFGHSGPSIYRGSKQQVLNPLRDSVVHDWDAAEKLIEYAMTDGLRLRDLTENPLLVTEASWTPNEGREKMMEIAFENLQAPAYFSVDRSVVSAFAAGRGTALVVDVGEDSSSVTPIYDGFVLRKGIQRSPLCASLVNTYLSSIIRQSTNPPMKITPQYLVKTKQSVEPSAAPKATLRTERIGQATDSFNKYAENLVIHEFKESVAEVLPFKWNDNAILSRGAKNFEFPDGFNLNIHPSVRYMCTEALFSPETHLPKEFIDHPQPASQATIATPPLSQAIGLHNMVMKAVESCDPDIVPSLMSNIVVVGGTSLFPGFTERLNFELSQMARGNKAKIHASGNTVERRYASWLGASILGSLGTFHQLWISKEEYQEQGARLIHSRSK